MSDSNLIKTGAGKTATNPWLLLGALPPPPSDEKLPTTGQGHAITQKIGKYAEKKRATILRTLFQQIDRPPQCLSGHATWMPPPTETCSEPKLDLNITVSSMKKLQQNRKTENAIASTVYGIPVEKVYIWRNMVKPDIDLFNAAQFVDCNMDIPEDVRSHYENIFTDIMDNSVWALPIVKSYMETTGQKCFGLALLKQKLKGGSIRIGQLKFSDHDIEYGEGGVKWEPCTWTSGGIGAYDRVKPEEDFTSLVLPFETSRNVP